MFGLQTNNHALEMERLHHACDASGAPDMMWDFLKLLSVKTCFDISSGTSAMIQPFISGRFSDTDAINISLATGYAMDMQGVQTVEHYQTQIIQLYGKLK